MTGRIPQNSKFRLVNIISIGMLLAITLTLTSCKSREHALETVYRINCGSEESYKDGVGNVWAADQGFSESKTATREKTLPIHNTAVPEVYRTERYNMERYVLPVQPGLYTIHLHFAETFDCNYQAGSRSFGASVNGKTVVEKFDPYTAAGGFARPVIIEYAGCIARDKIEIKFTNKAAINGIEVFKAVAGTPEAIRQITPVVDPDEAFIGKRLDAARDAKTYKILFIGNSMTFYWAIPESVQEMLEAGTRDVRIEPHRSLYGGKWLEYHYNKTDAIELIKTGGFDIVVLQEGSEHPLKKTDLFFEYAEKFDKVIRGSGARTLLYPSPMHRNNTDADRRQVMRLFTQLSKKINAKIIPVCETLRLCYAERPDVVWHNADGVHMGMHGGYAVACTFYAALTGNAPFPPPAILAQQVEIDPDLAVFIQEKARQAVAAYYKVSE